MIALREACDLAAFGGKAVQLGEALRAGLPVPDGFALSAPWVDRVVAGDGTALEEMRRLLPKFRETVAVRSSAVGEDSAGASFAGQHATCLHIEPTVEAVVAAVRQVWESGQTDSARAYRQRMRSRRTQACRDIRGARRCQRLRRASLAASRCSRPVRAAAAAASEAVLHGLVEIGAGEGPVDILDVKGRP